MPTKNKELTIHDALVKACSHPHRVHAFGMIAERPTSTNEIAADLGEEPTRIAYHVRALVRLKLIEVAIEKKRRGATEYFYTPTQPAFFSDAEWAKLSPEERRRPSLWTVQRIMLDIARSMDAGIFDQRDDQHLSRAPLLVDEEGWKRLVKAHAQALTIVLEVQGECLNRAAEREAKGEADGRFPIVSFQVLFEAGPARRRNL